MTNGGSLGEVPALRVVRGTPDAAELAALVTVLMARASVGDDTSTQPAPRSKWVASPMRGPLPRGEGAWRASAWR